MVVFDKGYYDYVQFACWTKRGIYFVTRQKNNAKYNSLALLCKQNRVKGKAKVLNEEIVEQEYVNKEVDAKDVQKELYRRICYQDEQNRKFTFLTNTVGIEAEEVALLYKKRWGIELLFYGKYLLM
jgi:IS4 transposase